MKRGLFGFFVFLLFLLNFVSAAPKIKNATFENINVTNDLTVGYNTNIGNNLDVGQNISATGGFFEFLGTSISRITNGWFTGLNVIDLVVDTNTLFVDSTNNRVGIGTTTPTYKLEVNGFGFFGNSADHVFISPDPDGLQYIQMRNKSMAGGYIAHFGTTGTWGIDERIGDFLIENEDKYGRVILKQGIFDIVEDPHIIITNTSIELMPKTGSSIELNGSVNVAEDAKISTDLIVDTNTLFVNSNLDRVGIGTANPQNALNVIGATNSTEGFIVGPNIGITANYSVGNCWMSFSGGIMYASNCTEI